MILYLFLLLTILPVQSENLENHEISTSVDSQLQSLLREIQRPGPDLRSSDEDSQTINDEKYDADQLYNEIYGSSANQNGENQSKHNQSTQSNFPPTYLVTLGFLPAAFYRLCKKGRQSLKQATLISILLSFISITTGLYFAMSVGLMLSIQAKITLFATVFLISFAVLALPSINEVKIKRKKSNRFINMKSLNFRNMTQFLIVALWLSFMIASAIYVPFAEHEFYENFERINEIKHYDWIWSNQPADNRIVLRINYSLIIFQMSVATVISGVLLGILHFRSKR